METMKEMDGISVDRFVWDYNETGSLEVSGTGKLEIRNTGGSSASEGGMGSGSDDDREKGTLLKPGDKSGTASTNEGENGFDPIGQNIKEKTAERAAEKD